MGKLLRCLERNRRREFHQRSKSRMLQQLAASRLIDLYEVEGKSFANPIGRTVREGSKSKWPAKQSCRKLQQLAAIAASLRLRLRLRLVFVSPPSLALLEGVRQAVTCRIKLFFIFRPSKALTYEEDQLLSDTLPVSQDDYDLLN